MSTRNSDKPAVGRTARGLACAALLIVLSARARAEEEPFAKDEGEAPAESLRKALRKMSRVEESAKAWIEKSRSDPAVQAGPAQVLKGIETRQGEIEQDLARLVLKLQKG